MRKEAILCLALLAPASVQAHESLHYSQSDFGGVGLLQMPTARMSPEGEFSFFMSHVSPYTRGGIVAQPYPWVEALFRYTNIGNRLYGESIAGDQDLKDKGFDLKLRLLEESFLLPQISAGFRDVGGTGLFSGEYLVASKQWGRFDFTFGMGWGYLASRGNVSNPLTLLSERFEDRNASTGQGGEFSIGNYFSGDRASLFGGVEYHAPWAPMVFKVEYDGNDYQSEPQDNDQPASSALNFGVLYKVNEAFDISLGWERGEEVMLGFSLHTNFILDAEQPKVLDPKPVSYNPHADVADDIDWSRTSRLLRDNAGLEVSRIERRGNEVVLIADQKKYRNVFKAYGRASRILANALEPDVRWFSFVETERGLPLQQTTIDRFTAESVFRYEKGKSELYADAEVIRPELAKGELEYLGKESPFRYWVSPGFTQSVGGPDGFILYEISAKASAEYSLQPNTWLSGGLVAGVISNFEKFEYEAPSNLPRVRTDIKDYLTTSDVRLGNLQLTHVEQLSDDWFAQGYAGYLESMFGGVGAEILYRPFGEQWAVGADINYVQQRDFDMRFGFRDYSVITGHATFYYPVPWLPSTLAKVSAGRYLAKDIGVTFDFSRSFGNGVKLGAWATFTDVSSEAFGEGSFDKGVYVEMPLDLFFAKSSAQSTRLNWSFLTRDGGARLNRRYQLYGLVERSNRVEVRRQFSGVLD